jgi:RHS repeat-associated protein
LLKYIEKYDITAETGSSTNSYSYDDQGRRISKTVNGTVTKYKYDGWNVLRETDGSGNTLVEYTYDQSGKPFSMRRNSATYYYTYNARGDITAVVDSNGAVTNSYSYNPWGKITASTENVENPYRYASYRYDSETGLYYLQNRYYSPDIMRFISRDAVKDQVGKPATSNFYAYAGGNPIMNIDPNGKWFWEVLYVLEWIDVWIWGPAVGCYIVYRVYKYYKKRRKKK